MHERFGSYEIYEELGAGGLVQGVAGHGPGIVEARGGPRGDATGALRRESER